MPPVALLLLLALRVSWETLTLLTFSIPSIGMLLVPVKRRTLLVPAPSKFIFDLVTILAVMSYVPGANSTVSPAPALLMALLIAVASLTPSLGIAPKALTLMTVANAGVGARSARRQSARIPLMRLP